MKITIHPIAHQGYEFPENPDETAWHARRDALNKSIALVTKQLKAAATLAQKIELSRKRDQLSADLNAHLHTCFSWVKG